MKFILGTKQEMTQIWRNDIAIPVTKVKLEPGVVVQVKTVANDDYNSVVVGYGSRRAKNIAKPQQGQTKGLGNFRYLKEFRYVNKQDMTEFSRLSRGLQILTDTFEAGDSVDVVGVSKGKGFQGVVKRHRFHGHNTTHGTKDQVRMPGSIGAGEPQHVFKGTRMGGHMGDQQVTIKNLEVIEVNAAEGYMYVNGAIPGARNGVLYIKGQGDLKIGEKVEVVETKQVIEKAPVKEAIAEPVTEEVVIEKVETAPMAETEVVTETPVAEVVAEVAVPEVKKDHMTLFNELSKEEQEKYSSEKVSDIIATLETQYRVDLVPVVMKLAVKELTLESLESYLINDAKLEPIQAVELAKALNEQIIK
ncbi:MAG: 50S ribosomal protein L3 [bacterium]